MARLNFLISDELAAALEAAAKEKRVTKSEIVRRAIAMYEIARQAQQRGESVGVGKNGKMETEIAGL